MSRVEILISGFGGQGVIRIGQILGLAGVKSGLRATMLKSHGTETRGGYVRAQVVLSDSVIDSMNTENPDIFVAMSKAAYDRFYHLSGENGIIVYDPAYVMQLQGTPAEQRPVAARDLAVEKVGKELFANVIILGYIIRKLDGLIDYDSAVSALTEIMPRAHEENRKAFDIGYSFQSV